MTRPNIIFNIRYRYTQYCTKTLSFKEEKNRVNTGDAYDYYDRDEACDKTISSKDAFDYYDYRVGSKGGFTSDGDIGAKESQQLCDLYKPEVLYQAVCSFRKDFAIDNNIVIKENMKKLITKSMKSILNQLGFNPDNIVWSAYYHTNTENPHCHIAFYEKDPTRRLHRLPKSQVEKARSKIVSILEINTGLYISKDETLKDIIKIVDECHLSEEMKSIISNSTNNSIKPIKGLDKIVDLMIDLDNKLPKTGSMKYNSKKIRPYHNDIRKIIDEIYKLDHVNPYYAKYNEILQEIRSRQEELYGTGNQEYVYKDEVLIGTSSGLKSQEHYQQKELYKLETRLANMILRNIIQSRNDIDHYKKEQNEINKKQLTKPIIPIIDDKEKRQSLPLIQNENDQNNSKLNTEHNKKNKRSKIYTKRYQKKIMKTRCRTMSYGFVQELSYNIQTAYYANLAEKQKIQDVIRSAQLQAQAQEL